MPHHQTENSAPKWPKHGFSQIAVVGVSEEKLTEIRKAVAARLGADITPSVTYFQLDEFLAALGPPLPTPPPPKVKYINGWKSTATYVVLSPAETKAREDGLRKLMAELIMRESRSKPTR
jgi:hypothetical protein